MDKEEMMKQFTMLIVLFCILGATLAGAPPTLTLLSPQDGAYWQMGSRQTISWNVVPNFNATVYMTIWGYNAGNQLIPFGSIGEQTYKAGSFLWQVGDCPSRKVDPGNYFIRIWFFYSGQKVAAGNKNPIHITPNWLKRIN
jgi:hypothetical protein